MERRTVKEEQSRQPYEKPRLRTVELVTEEVLAVGCKLQVAPAGPLLPPNCPAAGCVNAGS